MGMAVEAALALFRERFPDEEPTIVTLAPGRVNLIGEHTDYSDGFVFPAAIDAYVAVAACAADGPSLLTSQERGDGKPFDVASIAPGDFRAWNGYAAGVAWALREARHPVRTNIHAAVASNLPIGAGVSSSAAVELAFGVLWNELDALELDATQLALIGQRAENGFVGMNCGVMDQMASARGRDGQAMFLDTRPPYEARFAPIPQGLSIVLCDTGKSRALASSKYNERREEVERAAKALGVAALRDATMDQLERLADALDHVAYRRARHVISENDRCLRFAEALERKDLATVGALMRASHESLRDDYEVSCPELDLMAEAAWEAPGCVGARLTGAGFGGACVALVLTDKVRDFEAATDEAYRTSASYEPKFLVCRPAEGAHVVRH